MNPPIVINAFQRPLSLKRLLSSLEMASIPNDVDLIFSLEGGAIEEVRQLAETFQWKYGGKQIIQHESRKGLIEHFRYCGNLSKKYGAIVYLEDDLFVGKAFYSYSLEVLRYYANETRLAGFSLNSLWFNGYLHTPFNPIDDGNACFFLQVPWYQGQIYTARQWEHFELWLSSKKEMAEDLMIHDSFRNFPNDDWFPIKTQYLIETGKYYGFPRISHCVNFGDTGTHFKRKTNFFQTELAVGIGNINFISFSESLAVYDSFYEIERERLKLLAPFLKDYDFVVDLNGMKKLSLVTSPFIITNRKSNNSVMQFGLEMKPHELNIIYQIQGNFFHLSEVKQVIEEPGQSGNFLILFNYHHRYKLKRKETLQLILQFIRSLWPST